LSASWLTSPSHSFRSRSITSPWVQRALVAGGFGIGRRKHEGELVGVTPHTTETVKSVLPGGASSEGSIVIHDDDDRISGSSDEEKAKSGGSSETDIKHSLDRQDEVELVDEGSVFEALISPRTPFFHLDLQEAVRAATADARS
jgi:sodium-independent sulfate anion transporter 11